MESRKPAWRAQGFYRTKMTAVSERTRAPIKRSCSNCIKHILALLMNTEGRWVKSLFSKINVVVCCWRARKELQELKNILLIIFQMRHLFLPSHIWKEKQMSQNASAFFASFFFQLFQIHSQEELLRLPPCLSDIQTPVLHEAVLAVFASM